MAPKASARRKRAKREYEATDIAAMMRRQMRGYARKVGAADPVDLAEMIALRAEFDRAIEAAVAEQRRSFSWATIADALGVSRQAAHQRYGHVGGGASLPSGDARHSAA